MFSIFSLFSVVYTDIFTDVQGTSSAVFPSVGQALWGGGQSYSEVGTGWGWGAELQ